MLSWILNRKLRWVEKRIKLKADIIKFELDKIKDAKETIECAEAKITEQQQKITTLHGFKDKLLGISQDE